MLEEVSRGSVTCPEVETCNKYVFVSLPSCQLTDLPQDNHICYFTLLPCIPLSCFQELKDIPPSNQEWIEGFSTSSFHPFFFFILFFSPFLLLFFFPSSFVSNSSISPCPLPLWSCRSIQILTFWIFPTYCVCSFIFLQKICFFFDNSSLMTHSQLQSLYLAVLPCFVTVHFFFSTIVSYNHLWLYLDN